MRCLLALLTSLALAACSSSGNQGGSSPDSSIGPGRPVGASCDTTLANACAPAATSCATNVCASGVCVVILLDDAGPACTGDAGSLPPTGSVCATNSDCAGGTVCGFSSAGCLATGVCVIPAATSTGLPAPACGCNGLSDPYVANDFTGTPAASPGACVDGGASDGGGADGGLDGAASVNASRDGGGPADGAGADASDGASE